ncbi:MAG: chemotaxis protein CheW, partial [Pseudomonadota bacterium]
MSKQSPFAREDVMEAYLDSLLKEPQSPDDVTARTAKLLEQASQQMAETALSSAVEKIEDNEQRIVEDVSSFLATPEKDVNQEETTEDAVVNQEERVAEPVKQKVPLKDTLGYRFQALFFEVAGLTL